MRVFISLVVVGIVLGRNLHLRKRATCTNSADCTSSTPCCRDSNGHAIVQLEGGFHFGVPESQSGTCSSLLGQEGDMCDSSCGCQSGYKCYRPMSGVCCPPSRCYNATWVAEQEHYWANCRPPTCFFPP